MAERNRHRTASGPLEQIDGMNNGHAGQPCDLGCATDVGSGDHIGLQFFNMPRFASTEPVSIQVTRTYRPSAHS